MGLGTEPQLEPKPCDMGCGHLNNQTRHPPSYEMFLLRITGSILQSLKYRKRLVREPTLGQVWERKLGCVLISAVSGSLGNTAHIIKFVALFSLSLCCSKRDEKKANKKAYHC